MYKVLIITLTIFISSSNMASAGCSVVKPAIWMGVAGAAAALALGAGAITAPFTGGTSAIAATAASGKIFATIAAIGTATAKSAAAVGGLAKVGGIGGVAAGTAIGTTGCIVD